MLQSHRLSMHSHLALRHLIHHVAERRQNGIGLPVLPRPLAGLIDEVCQLFEPFTGVARAGYECQFADDRWEISVFLGGREAVGGPLDGELQPVNFRFDVQGLARLFEQVYSIGWNAIPNGHDCLGAGTMESFLTAEGVAGGQRVSLRVHAVAPDEAGPGQRQHADGRLELV